MRDGRTGPRNEAGRMLRYGLQNLSVPLLWQRHTREHGPRQVPVRVETGTLQLLGRRGWLVPSLVLTYLRWELPDNTMKTGPGWREENPLSVTV